MAKAGNAVRWQIGDWEMKRLDDFYNGVIKPLPKDFAASVFRLIATDFQRLVQPQELAPHLHRWELLTSNEYTEMTDSEMPLVQKISKLLEVLPTNNDRDGSSVHFTYLSLMDSYEHSLGVGVSTHIELAKVIWRTARVVCGVDVEEQERDNMDVCSLISKLKQLEVSPATAAAFIANLGLNQRQSGLQLNNVQEITQYWLQVKGQNCTMEDLVQALLFTPGLGHLVSGLLPPSSSNPPEVFNFIRTLGRWTHFACYLGFSDDQIMRIEVMSRYSLKNQLVMFLRLWQMPDCGRRTRRMLEMVAIQEDFETIADPEQGIMEPLPDGVHRALSPTMGRVTQLFQGPGKPMNFYFANGDISAFPPASETVLLQPAVSPLLADDASFQSSPISLATTSSSQPKALPNIEAHSECNLVKEHHTKVKKPPERTKDTVHTDPRADGSELLCAAKLADWELAKGLIASGSLPNYRCDEGKTALMYACIHGRQDVVQLLLEKNADLAARDHQGRCCLHFRDVLNKKQLVQYLLNEFQKRNLQIDVDTYDSHHTPLTVACLAGGQLVDAAELLLDHGAKADGHPLGSTKPLIAASTSGNIDLVTLLLEKGSQVDIRDNDGCTPLIQACMCHHFNIARKLVMSGANVNQKDQYGNTALTAAVSGNSYEIVQLLLGKHADVEVSRDVTNDVIGGCVEVTPLADACARGFLGIATLLIQHGANVNYMCSGQVPPIGFAIICRQKHIVQFLLTNDMVALNKSLYSLQAPFIIAVKVNDMETAGLLLSEMNGLENALLEAQNNNLQELAHHIQWYRSTVPECLQGAPLNTTAESNKSVATAAAPAFTQDHSRVYEVLQRFCQICVDAFIDENRGKDCETLIGFARAECGNSAASFLQRCFDGTQRIENLNQDFLGGNPSPAMFLIQNKLLSDHKFIVHAMQYYPEDSITTFWESLVSTFHQIPGGESLPGDIHQILGVLFNGQFPLNIQIAPGFSPPLRKQVSQIQTQRVDSEEGTSGGCPSLASPSTREKEAVPSELPTKQSRKAAATVHEGTQAKDVKQNYAVIPKPHGRNSRPVLTESTKATGIGTLLPKDEHTKPPFPAQRHIPKHKMQHKRSPCKIPFARHYLTNPPGICQPPPHPHLYQYRKKRPQFRSIPIPITRVQSSLKMSQRTCKLRESDAHGCLPATGTYARHGRLQTLQFPQYSRYSGATELNQEIILIHDLVAEVRDLKHQLLQELREIKLVLKQSLASK